MSRILIVEHDPHIRASLRHLFETHGEFVVCGEAGTAAEAIKKAERLRPGLIILDFAIPSANGFEVVGELRVKLPTVQIFLLLDHPSFELEREAVSRGILAVFAKDEDWTPLISNARAVCGIEHPEGRNGNVIVGR